MLRRAVLFLLAVAAAIGAWVAVTSLTPGASIATWAPCPRNWGWTDSYHPRQSPLQAMKVKVGNAHVKVCYGSPALRGREMIGGNSIPFGKIWRTGANEPTTIHTDHVVRLGDIVLGAGSYSLYTVPGERDWTVILNRSTRQWGLESEYTEAVAAQEVGRFETRARKLDSAVENLTFHSEPSASAAAEIVLEWQNTQLRLPLDVGFADADPDDAPSDPNPE
ncbi:MAG: DUF2911 domain-containing protein [Thermoanaerobaculia bacterium]